MALMVRSRLLLVTTLIIGTTAWPSAVEADEPIDVACRVVDGTLRGLDFGESGNQVFPLADEALSAQGLGGVLQSPACSLVQSSPTGASVVTQPPEEGGNPWGCYGQTHNPHHSDHRPGRANAGAKTECAVTMAYVAVYSWLYYWNGSNWILKDSNEAHKYIGRKVEVFVNADCVNPGSNETWQATSYHEASDGERYGWAYTSNTKTFPCGSGSIAALQATD